MESKVVSGITLALLLLIVLTLVPNAQSSKVDFGIDEPSRRRVEQASIFEHRIMPPEIDKLKLQIGVGEEWGDYNQIIDGHGTGLRPPSEKTWEKIANQAYFVESILLDETIQSPSSVDLSTTPWFPPIGNQDGEGSCTTWAVGYYMKTFQEAKEHGWDLSGAQWEGGYYGEPSPAYQNRITSPDFIYHLINGGVDLGSSFEDAIRLVCGVGASSWGKMPYDPVDHAGWPSEESWEEASWYRGNSSGYEYMNLITNNDLTSLKNWLASDHLAVIAVDANRYPYLTSTDVWTLDNYVNPSLNHANTIVGYDDNIQYTEAGQSRHGAFKIANSWGIGSWEHVYDGYYWISYEAMKQRVGWCMFYHDRLGYKPELAASFRIDHSKRGECGILIGMDTHNAPAVTKSFSDLIIGGAYPFCVNDILFDITEFKSAVPTIYGQPYFLRVSDGGTSTTGTIINFSIHASALSGISENTPINTVNGAYVFADAVLPNTIEVPFYNSTIQGAINSVILGLDRNPRVTIQVAAGTYHEHVVVNKTVSLIGEDSRSTVIDGNGSGYVVTVQNVHNNLSIKQFTIRNGSRGFSISSSSNITICGNNIESSQIGIFLSNVSNSTIFHNNFVHNLEQVSTLNVLTSVWDDGYPSGGNYWSNYVSSDLFSGSFQNIAGSDGICDAPYVVNADNQDRYPLKKPYPWRASIGDLNGDGVVNSLDIGVLNAHWSPAGGTPPWSLGYDLNLDCNGDGYINSLDIGVVNAHWGQSW